VGVRMAELQQKHKSKCNPMKYEALEKAVESFGLANEFEVTYRIPVDHVEKIKLDFLTHLIDEHDFPEIAGGLGVKVKDSIYEGNPRIRLCFADRYVDEQQKITELLKMYKTLGTGSCEHELEVFNFKITWKGIDGYDISVYTKENKVTIESWEEWIKKGSDQIEQTLKDMKEIDPNFNISPYLQGDSREIDVPDFIKRKPLSEVQ